MNPRWGARWIARSSSPPRAAPRTEIGFRSNAREGRPRPPFFFSPGRITGRVARTPDRIAPMRRGLAGVVVGILAGAALLADASDAVKAELARERRRQVSDSKSLSDTSRRLETALNQLASARRSVARGGGRGDAPPAQNVRRDAA